MINADKTEQKKLRKTAHIHIYIYYFVYKIIKYFYIWKSFYIFSQEKETPFIYVLLLNI